MADSGVYYLDGDEKGRRTWEAFLTGGVKAVDRVARGEDGTLTLGGCTFPINSDEDSKLARFVCDFYRCMYQCHTGNAAPAAWQEAAEEEESVSTLGQTVTKASVAGAILTAAGNLLRSAMTPRVTVQRPTLQHPAARQASRRPAPPARPAQQRPAKPSLIQPTRMQPAAPKHQPRSAHPAGPGRPGRMGRPGSARPGGMSRPGGRGPGGPGRGRR